MFLQLILKEVRVGRGCTRVMPLIQISPVLAKQSKKQNKTNSGQNESKRFLLEIRCHTKFNNTIKWLKQTSPKKKTSGAS